MKRVDRLRWSDSSTTSSCDSAVSSPNSTIVSSLFPRLFSTAYHKFDRYCRRNAPDKEEACRVTSPFDPNRFSLDLNTNGYRMGRSENLIGIHHTTSDRFRRDRYKTRFAEVFQKPGIRESFVFRRPPLDLPIGERSVPTDERAVK